MLGMVTPLLAIDFSIHHYGCPACQSTEKYPNVEMKILSSRTSSSDRASVLQYAKSSNRDDVNHFLCYWKNHGSVTKLRVADKLEKNILFNVSLKSQGGCWVTKAIINNDAVFLGQVPVYDGLEYWSVLVGEGNKSPLFSQLDNIGVVKINRIEKLNMREILKPRLGNLSGLSPRQLLVLKTALDEGYFESPRRISSRKLAFLVGISQSTLLEHLRKAESKVIQIAFDPSQRIML